MTSLWCLLVKVASNEKVTSPVLLAFLVVAVWRFEILMNRQSETAITHLHTSLYIQNPTTILNQYLYDFLLKVVKVLMFAEMLFLLKENDNGTRWKVATQEQPPPQQQQQPAKKRLSSNKRIYYTFHYW